jgi:hypothetical protein
MTASSKLSLSDEDKVHVLISMMASVREHVTDWHNRAYNAAAWSVGLMVAIAAFAINRHQASIFTRLLLAMSVVVFLALGQGYLRRARKAIEGNGRVLIKCEAALQLTEVDSYLNDQRFFDVPSDGEWVHAEDFLVLSWFHLAIGLGCAILILVLG